MKSEIGKRLKILRKERGWTQKELAKRVSGGLDYTYIGKIEREEQLPSLRILLGLSEALSVPVGHFFPEETPAGLAQPPARGRETGRGRLLWAVNGLHDDDLALLLEIAQVLQRHRERGQAGPLRETPADGLLAAEGKTPYGEGESD